METTSIAFDLIMESMKTSGDLWDLIDSSNYESRLYGLTEEMDEADFEDFIGNIDMFQLISDLKSAYSEWERSNREDVVSMENLGLSWRDFY